LVDIPNHRSSHKTPTPRGGGLAIILSLLLALIIAWTTGNISISIKSFFVYLSVIILMMILGYISDIIYIPVVIRLIFQIAIAAIAVLTLPIAQEFSLIFFSISGWLLSLLFIIWLVTNINYFNFMDGLNGFSGFQAITASFVLLYLGHIILNDLITNTATFLILALVVFLNHNLKGRLFLGDVGSYTIGFLIILLSLFDARLIIPVALTFSWFIFDATITILRRIVCHQAWCQSHRSHFYQRANIIGYSHQQVSLIGLVFFLIFSALGITYFYTEDLLLIFLALMICSCLACIIKKKEITIKENKS